MRIERWWYTAPLRLKSIFRRRRLEGELDEELQFHLEHKIEEGITEGLTPEEARLRALRAMGGLSLVGTGTVIGLAMGFGLERLMNSMLFSAGGIDLLVYLIVVPAIILVTILAAYVPARRASRISPTVALRYE
jgi:hypothetical protein